ncbi:MAG: hemerythrin domain-containing protein [Pseudomonadota bacterium]|nr:hemerythrin domain-containing protein [Pseudomonadota bacterium]
MTQQDACTLLDTDHQKVERLFTEYQSAQNASRKSQLAQEICMELTVHATIEEEIFYPAFLAATRDDKLVEDAEEEHQEAKDLIAEIEDGDKIDPMMARLQKAIEHHVKEERTEMFPKARKAAGMDLMALGAQLEARKKELMANFQKV